MVPVFFPLIRRDINADPGKMTHDEWEIHSVCCAVEQIWMMRFSNFSLCFFVRHDRKVSSTVLKTAPDFMGAKNRAHGLDES